MDGKSYEDLELMQTKAKDDQVTEDSGVAADAGQQQEKLEEIQSAVKDGKMDEDTASQAVDKVTAGTA